MSSQVAPKKMYVEWPPMKDNQTIVQYFCHYCESVYHNIQQHYYISQFTHILHQEFAILKPKALISLSHFLG